MVRKFKVIEAHGKANEGKNYKAYLRVIILISPKRFQKNRGADTMLIIGENILRLKKQGEI